MNTLEALKLARSKLVQGWCEGVRAVDETGAYVAGNDPRAVRWCALGALDAVVPSGDIDDYKDHVRELSHDVPEPYRGYISATSQVAQYSNRRGQKAAIELYDTTIKRLSEPYWNCLQGLRI